MPHKKIFFLILFFTVMRLVVAPSFGLGVDEAHYVLYGHFLDLSYVDHPPLVGWTQALFAHLFGESVFWARVPAILLMMLISWESYRFLLFSKATESQALWGVTALNSSFMFGAIGLMLLPENFLLALVFPIIMSVLRIEADGKTTDYIWLGIWLGLAGLSKYTAVILLPPLLLYILSKRRFDLLINPRILLSAIIGFILILPVIFWNASHQWVSFAYQSSHVAGSTVIAFKPFIRSLAAQFGAYNPFLFIIAIYGIIVSFRSKNSAIILALWIGLSIELFFILTSFLKPVLPHWPALFYLLFIPIGTVALLSRGGKYGSIARGSILISLLLSLLIHAELSAKWGDFPDYKSPFRDIYGFDTQIRDGVTLLNALPTPKKALAVTNWSYGSRLHYYALPYGIKTFVLDNYNRQFALWEKESPIGYDLILLHSHFSDIPDSLQCEETQTLKKEDILLNGRKVDTVEYLWCKNYQGIGQTKVTATQ
ncbi:glycosyltransferase family 39 protein [Sulfuricurvum sp.]|uniref:ArnT family glycosyltransferase n=1 Tax=Sulfuricurvum sp. TaxID=2025608 RepID=UPI0026145105|nr:glycosyltransferase family 39 protein [Sulfuricurvum sp.]MDD2266478.1 glycosyltransferase family 39 protein [Sulfuricurvum sp.]MDD2782686.1 glycosyltransferase family 39 protein [Sulfuricurvum sp.]